MAQAFYKQATKPRLLLKGVAPLVQAHNNSRPTNKYAGGNNGERLPTWQQAQCSFRLESSGAATESAEVGSHHRIQSPREGGRAKEKAEEEEEEEN